VNITWADSERGWGPTGTAIRTGEPQLIQDMLHDPRVRVWKAAMVQRGYRSSASLPLKDARGIFGALTIFAGAPDAFIPEEVELLRELEEINRKDSNRHNPRAKSFMDKVREFFAG